MLPADAPGRPEARWVRGHLDFLNFYHEHCEQYGKKIIFVGEEGLDMSTPMERMFAETLVQFAEWGLQTIGERRRQGQTSPAARAFPTRSSARLLAKRSVVRGK